MGVKAGSDIETARKLEDICQNLAQNLTLPAEQGKVVESLTNPENAKRINGLVEDIHEALMGYQVGILNYSYLTISDHHPRLHYSRISTRRVVSSLWVLLPHPLSLQTNQWIGVGRPYPSQRNASCCRC